MMPFWRRRPACTMHEAIEGVFYPYRCARCGRCYLCGHILLDYAIWVCHDETRTPTTYAPGVQVTTLPS